ncbi:hypothetical protein BBP40_005001 [Aspergillus hancockii]|nr:hypothetical protein BBP40_005001 [Aspergillus hancockii]
MKPDSNIAVIAVAWSGSPYMTANAFNRLVYLLFWRTIEYIYIGVLPDEGATSTPINNDGPSNTGPYNPIKSKSIVERNISEETLDVEATRDPSSATSIDEAQYRHPKLERFVGSGDEIGTPKYIGQGEQGIVLEFKRDDKYLCLKLFWNYKDPSNDLHPHGEKTLSPFGCESRAFAHLCDLHQNGYWARTQLQLASGRERYDPRWNEARWAIVKGFVAD